MLFNSLLFIGIFLPFTLIGFHLILRFRQFRAALIWLIFASLVFYGYWNIKYVILLVSSVIVNYSIGRSIFSIEKNTTAKKCLLFIGVALNLLAILYFKYANFTISIFNSFSGVKFNFANIILPLAISFFTFQQIAFLVDAYKKELHDLNFIKYFLFVIFFPQLIAGPIVHHSDVMDQFTREHLYQQEKDRNLAIGITIFSLGLFKKVILADTVSTFATPIFDSALSGTNIGFLDGWQGALAYSLQLYYDFSGYSDMAIGSALMFGIVLPNNFNSPYKSTSITAFWSRWHMTLSRFLKDYLYIPLGGNRKGEFRQKINLMITMLLGGLWHGSGWTFVFWGGLHGSYLIIHKQWESFFKKTKKFDIKNNFTIRSLCITATFICVTFTWVFFRAETMNSGFKIVSGMFGLSGLGTTNYQSIIIILSLLCLTMSMPNTQEWVGRFFQESSDFPENQARGLFSPQDKRNQPRKIWQTFMWMPNRFYAITFSMMTLISLLLTFRRSEFIYFQF